MVNSIVIVAVHMAFFIIFIKYFKEIFFISHLKDLVLPLNTFSVLKYISLVIIILLYEGI